MRKAWTKKLMFQLLIWENTYFLFRKTKIRYKTIKMRFKEQISKGYPNWNCESLVFTNSVYAAYGPCMLSFLLRSHSKNVYKLVLGVLVVSNSKTNINSLCKNIKNLIHCIFCKIIRTQRFCANVDHINIGCGMVTCWL